MASIIDAVLYLDGLMLEDGDSMENVVEFIQKSLMERDYQLGYDIKYMIEYEEEVVDD